MITVVTASELKTWVDEQRRFALVDVLPEEYFNAERLPEARRACVYEITFLDQITALGIAPDEPIVVYGAGTGSLDSTVAAEKLERAGFTQIFNFRGGRVEWSQVGGLFEGAGFPPAPARPEEKVYTIDCEKSMVEWIGRSLTATHRGTVRVDRGEIRVASGHVTGGEMLLDMRTIQSTDLPEPALRQLLDAHLKSDDFFDVERYPAAKLKILSAKRIPGAPQGSSNFAVEADLTLKDVSRLIVFPAIVSTANDGTLAAVTQMEIDRTQWNVLYGSGRFFQMLGKHLVNDMITLLVRIVAE